MGKSVTEKWSAVIKKLPDHLLFPIITFSILCKPLRGWTQYKMQKKFKNQDRLHQKIIVDDSIILNTSTVSNCVHPVATIKVIIYLNGRHNQFR